VNTHARINMLWDQMRNAIDAAYAAENKANTSGAAIAGALRDYARDISWSDNLAALLGREAANERQHRCNRPAPRGFSIQDASKLIVMNCVARGAQLMRMPNAAEYLVYRQTAVEAQVVGFLTREHLPVDWRQAVDSLDYAKLMEAA
jgi:hypothetical protein